MALVGIPGGRGPRFSVDAIVGQSSEYVTRSTEVVPENLKYFYTGDTFGAATRPGTFGLGDDFRFTVVSIGRIANKINISQFILHYSPFVAAPDPDVFFNFALYRYVARDLSYVQIPQSAVRINITDTTVGPKQTFSLEYDTSTQLTVSLNDEDLFLGYMLEGLSPGTVGSVDIEVVNTTGDRPIPSYAVNLPVGAPFPTRSPITQNSAAGIGFNFDQIPAILFLSTDGARMFGVLK